MNEPAPIGDDGSQVLRTLLEPVIPAEAQGFTVRVGIGPYPPGRQRSNQRAVYAELTPASEHARSIMAAKNRHRVLGIVPLTPEGAEQIALAPGSPQAEHASTLALREALRLVRGS